MGLVYGIDFGTTNSTVMVGRDDGSVVPVRDRGSAHGLVTVPSTVADRPDGSVDVGAAAERARNAPQGYNREFKHEFGRPFPAVITGRNRQRRTYALVVEVLRFLRELARDQVPGDPVLTVVTVPATWESSRRELMLRAAGEAGFDPAAVRLVDEPVAAAVYAAAVAPSGSAAGGGDRGTGRTLVYDLGGGTFDCALVRTSARGGVEVLGTPRGLSDLGGGAFDRRVLDVLRQRFPELAAKFLDGPATDPDVRRRRFELRDACEQMKIRLSGAESPRIPLRDLDPPVSFLLTRAELADLIRPLLMETVAVCERLLADLGTDWAGVDRIVPVGGSCRMPLVGELLARHTGRPLLSVPDPGTAVAYGAVLCARSAAWAQQPLLKRLLSTRRHDRSPFDPDRGGLEK